MIPPMRHDLPSGTVTLLFTDVQGSTRLLHELGAEGYAHMLAEHRDVVRTASGRHGGVEVDYPGRRLLRRLPDRPGRPRRGVGDHGDSSAAPRARVLRAVGGALTFGSGDVETAVPLRQESLAIYEAL